MDESTLSISLVKISSAGQPARVDAATGHSSSMFGGRRDYGGQIEKLSSNHGEAA
jgi:hypothetical protein